MVDFVQQSIRSAFKNSTLTKHRYSRVIIRVDHIDYIGLHVVQHGPDSGHIFRDRGGFGQPFQAKSVQRRYALDAPLLHLRRIVLHKRPILNWKAPECKANPSEAAMETDKSNLTKSFVIVPIKRRAATRSLEATEDESFPKKGTEDDVMRCAHERQLRTGNNLYRIGRSNARVMRRLSLVTLITTIIRHISRLRLFLIACDETSNAGKGESYDHMGLKNADFRLQMTSGALGIMVPTGKETPITPAKPTPKPIYHKTPPPAAPVVEYTEENPEPPPLDPSYVPVTYKYINALIAHGHYYDTYIVGKLPIMHILLRMPERIRNQAKAGKSKCT
ncbi:unnamed protein product [Nesidiocoris tenuis]|uniref:Uncharacterized protein n=1 Tax=Nesidiocoris tenuis TaxID=355587 RepID=A0A6H5H6C3_9HEMI|nr:unnamed protein product [Nesidiocoris tenuis]